MGVPAVLFTERPYLTLLNKELADFIITMGNASTQIYADGVPSECPMHQKAPEPPSECPMHAQAASSTPSNDIDPRNRMEPPNQRPSPDQPFLKLERTKHGSTHPHKCSGTLC